MFSETPADPYLLALAEASAGLIELDPEDDPLQVQLALEAAAFTLGVRVISGWIGTRYDLLAWRCRTDEPDDAVVLAVWPDLVV